MKKCKNCLCHYSGDHECPPWLKVMVARFKKLNPEVCIFCQKRIIPDKEAVRYGTKKWDEHTYKYNCNCQPKSVRICIG